MDDDDEFGDLYADVLPISAPIQSQFNPQPPPPPLVKEIPKAATSFADLNDSSDDDDVKDRFLVAPNVNSTANLKSGSGSDPLGFDLNRSLGNSEGGGFKFDFKDRVLEDKNASVRLGEKGFGNSGFMDEADIDLVVEESDDKDDDFVVKDENSGGNGEKIKIIIGGLGQGETKTGDFLSDQMIPGLSHGGGGVLSGGGAEIRGNTSFDNDSDSDSEDDLRIVLNDTYHGPMVTERVGGAEGEDDEDEDGDALVIVADNDDHNNRLMNTDDPEWGGEEAGAANDGEKKEPGDASTKVSGIGGPSMAPKTGYSNHVYHHQFPSQFKYVRPGATPMTGPASSAGSVPGQVRPQSGMMMPVVGRGRGDWRPPGMKVPLGMQKAFHADYGAQVWGGGGAGRGYEFTLPSHKTIFEVDIDNFEEKPWRNPNMDVAEFFNFGLNEESWKDYCKQLEQFRLEKTMQSKIRVYESGRTEQDYDPDLPPELAAAAGIQDTPSESAKQGIPDDGQSDLTKGAARVRPPLPTGRAIPVETGSGERPPSTDMRKPRGIDYDAIITIKCEGSAEEDESQENDMAEAADHPENDRPTQDLTNCNEFEVIRHEDTDYADHYPNSRKSVNPGRRSLSSETVDDDTPRGDGSLRPSSETRSADSRERSPVYRGRKFSATREESKEKARVGRVRSPTLSTKVSSRDKSPTDDKKEGSLESADAFRSPVAHGNIADVDIEHKDGMNDDEIVAVVKEIETDDKEESLTDTREDDVISKHASKAQKLSSRVEPALPEEADNEEEDSKTGRSSDNSQARSGSSKDNWKRHSAVDEVRVGHSTRIPSHKKLDSRDEVHMRRKVLHDERQDINRHQNAGRGREDVYPHKGWGDPYSGNHPLAKHERDRRKEFDNSENVRQQRDEEIHGRRSRPEDLRKREHHGESVSRNRSKILDLESEKDERQIRKQVEINAGWRSGYERDIAVKHREREDHLKSRNDNIEDIHSKRRKEDTYMRREHPEREEMIHAHRETSGRRKRERDDVFDVRRRDDLPPPRLRNDDQQNIRLKDEVLFQRERSERQRDREREEWHRLKKSNEEMSSRKDKGEMNGVLMRGRVSDENLWTSQSRGKDDHRNIEKEYYSKEAEPAPGRQKELPKRREQVENSLSQNSAREDPHSRGSQISNNSDRRARHERASTRDDHVSNTSTDSRMHDKKHKLNPRKGKESEVVDRNSLAASKKNHQDKNSGQTSDTVRAKNRGVAGSDENKHPVSKRSRDDASSGDEQPESKRGRSKLERWTSNKERDFSAVVKPPTSSSMKTKPIDAPAVSSVASSTTSKHPSGDFSKTIEDDNEDRLKAGSNEKDGAGSVPGGDLKPAQDNVHLDTVEKLKKRSERFKLPMPVERETTTATATATTTPTTPVKKIETEQTQTQIPSSSSTAQTEIQGDSEVKAERPTRKRRWTSS